VIVAFLTDFGTRDHYVGAMKGVVLSICPETTLVDITHDIPPQDIVTAALELAASFRFFPPGTIFLAVVDPGVGSDRRGIAAEAGGYRFVGPDNGVLSPALRDVAPYRAVELVERRLARAAISRTFEGRDRFAPAAGWLARGTALEAFGPPIGDPVMLDLPAPAVTTEGVAGEVMRVDRFGNLITNIDRRLVDQAVGQPMWIDVCGIRLTGLVDTYASATPGVLCALIGSSGYLEIAQNRGSAAATLGAGRGAVVSVRRVRDRPTTGAPTTDK
jgi:S-adenosylmethionine hydrolase